MKRFLKIILNIFLGVLILGLIYFLTLCFPQPFFRNKVIVNNITVYSNDPLPEEKTKEIMKEAESRIKKSNIYKENTKQHIFITSNPILWAYFTSINHKVGGLNYVIFNHSIFLRKVNIEENRMYGPSGNMMGGSRTLDYFMTHEMTHTLEFQSMPRYKYPIKTNWVLEGYCEYIGHDSENYEEALNQYLNVGENTSAKYYTRARTMVTYLLEKENLSVSDLWNQTDNYDSILKRAIPNDKPLIDTSTQYFK